MTDNQRQLFVVLSQHQHPAARNKKKLVALSQRSLHQLTRLFHRLAVRNEPPDTEHPLGTAPILLLPPELILCINDFLGIPDLLSFSMTCKPLLCLCRPREMQIVPTHIQTFLPRYERESSRLLYCSQCHKLHQWSPHWRTSPLPGRPQSAIPACLLVEFFQSEWRATVPYHLARLALNRYHWGPQCGIPVENLDEDHSFTPKSPTGLQITQNTHHNILQGRLFQKSTLTISYGKSRSLEPLLRFLKETPLSYCSHHSSTREHYNHRRPFTLFFKYIDTRALESVVYFRQYAACSFCQTDWCLDFSFYLDGWVFRLHTYRHLLVTPPQMTPPTTQQDRAFHGHRDSPAPYLRGEIMQKWEALRLLKEAAGV